MSIYDILISQKDVRAWLLFTGNIPGAFAVSESHSEPEGFAPKWTEWPFCVHRKACCCAQPDKGANSNRACSIERGRN